MDPLLSGVVLAGGSSHRMGRDKAWITFEGKPLLEQAHEKLPGLGLQEVFISGRPDGDYSVFKCPVLLDLEPGAGPLGGIERALQACPTPLLVVLAVDLPNMTAEFLQKLAGRCDSLTGAVPRRQGELEPLAAIYPKRCHTFAFDLLARSRRSAREFAEACLREKAVRTVPVPASAAACFANWNQPADLQEADS